MIARYTHGSSFLRSKMNISEARMKLTTFSVSNAEKMEGGVRFRMAG